MAKVKYYSVKIGKEPGIYCTWEECKEQVSGVTGAIYKSFSSLKDAEDFLEQTEIIDNSQNQSETGVAVADMNASIEKAIAELGDNEVVAFVDGSYNNESKKSAFGAIIISSEGNKEVLYKAFTENLGSEFVKLRNVAAELEGVKESLNWAVKYKKNKITIYYDYTGIEQWANKEWKANNSITKKYVEFIEEKRKEIDISFVKVPAHSGVKLNEEVDQVAKSALLAKGHKTYNDGSVYFVGYGYSEWESIVSLVNNENTTLSEDKVAVITICKIEMDSREKITISDSKNVVTINCYGNNKSYVQGKQSVLFEKIISTAIGVLSNNERVIEVLNNYRALTIKPVEVENKFNVLIPNYRDGSTKNYTNLLSAVYNTMLTGYMPDYTSLVAPIFRSYEFYLHRILGDVMGLDTERKNGANNFSYFSKNKVMLYECNVKNNKLSSSQNDYLNKLYTSYNSVRHPYSHWSFDDTETAVITDITTARQLLLDGLKIINDYYNLF